MMIPTKKTARLAGLFFLLMVVFGLFAEVFFREKLFASEDIVATANNILANDFLYRIGILSDILMSLSYLFTALALYMLLASVNKNMAALMVLFATAGCVLLLFTIQSEFAPLYILSGNDYQSSFNSSQLQSLAMLYYKSYQHGYVIGQVFFALWVLPLGVLIYKSGFIPKIFGILFVVETIFGLMSVIVHFLVPNGTLETILLLPGTIAEFSFVLWLLIWGITESKPLPTVQKNYGV
jgi:hypothetical protein